MRTTPLILFFIKEPVSGRVKSRLSAFLGADAALELYRCFVHDMLTSIGASGIPLLACYHPPDAEAAVRRWLGGHLACRPQEGADVGERMEHAFRQVFAEGCPRAILVGSDIPDLPPSVITEAFRALDDHDAVIGPAQDGGYYLIGFRTGTFLPEVFRDIEWSTADVFSKTMKILDRAGLPVLQLPLWRDVDTLDDLRDLVARNGDTAFRRSRTMKYVSKGKFDIFPSEVRDAPI
jgi:rSAM/selenodomain-associated transferase 1